MSNTTQEFTAFMNLAAGDTDRHPQLVIVDGRRDRRRRTSLPTQVHVLGGC